MSKAKGRYVAAFLSASMLLSGFNVNVVEAAPSDINGHWAQSMINTWISRGYISGYPDNTFRPDAPISRAEFVVLVNKAFQVSALKDVNFNDVSASHWAYNEIKKGVARGYIMGYEDGSFRPGSEVTRQEAAAMLAQVKGLYGNSSGAAGYTDVNQIPTWSKGYIGSVTQSKIMSGYPDGSFHAKRGMTRAEAVSAINNAASVGVPSTGGSTTNNTTNNNTSSNTNNNNIVYDPNVNVNSNNSNTTVNSGMTMSSGTLRNKLIKGDLTIPSTLKGAINLIDVTVEGTVKVQGGTSVNIEGCNINRLTVKKAEITVDSDNSSKIKEVTFEQNGKLKGYGYQNIIIDDKNVKTVIVDARADSISLDTKATLKLYANADIDSFEATKDAENSTITFTKGAEVSDMELRSKVKITGRGTIDNMTVHEDGVRSDIRPKKVVTKNGADKPTYTNSGTSGSSSSSDNDYDNVTIDDDNDRFDGDGDRYNDVKVTVNGAKVSDMKVYGDLTITRAVGNGTVTLDGVDVKGDVYVYGGGENSVKFLNCDIDGDIISNPSNKDVSSSRQDDPVALKFDDDCSIGGTIRILGNTKIEPYSSSDKITIPKVTVEKELNKDVEIDMDVRSIDVEKPAKINLGSSIRVDSINIGSSAEVTTINLKSSTKVNNLEAYGKSKVDGSGTVDKIYAHKDVSVGSSIKNNEYITSGDIAVSGVTVSPKNTTVKVGGTTKLTATVEPVNASVKTVTWKSSDETIAKVDSNGTVTGVKEGGPVTITVTTTDGKKTADCLVTVSKDGGGSGSGIDTAMLDTVISVANTAKSGVVVSTNAALVAEGTKWVYKNVWDTFEKAIKAAEDAKTAATTSDDVTKAAAALNKAIETFNKAKLDGKKVNGGGTDPEDTKPSDADLKALDAAIKKANDKIANVKASEHEDGSDLQPGEKYLFKDIFDTFNKKITEAQDVRNSSASTKQQVTSATSALTSATDMLIIREVPKTGDADKDALKAAIADAQTLLDSIVASDDGKDVLDTQKWVTKEEHSSFGTLISSANKINTDKASKAEMKAMTQSLRDAIKEIEGNAKQGLKVSTDTTAFKAALDEAEKVMEKVRGSAAGDGTDVPNDCKWFVTEEYQKHAATLKEAKDFDKSIAGATQEKIKEMTDKLNGLLDVVKSAPNGTATAILDTAKKELEDAIEAAKEELATAEPSDYTDGSDMLPNSVWVYRPIYDALDSAIKKAADVLSSSKSTLEKYKDATVAVKEAQEAFTAAKKTGVKSVIIELQSIDERMAVYTVSTTNIDNGSKVTIDWPSGKPKGIGQVVAPAIKNGSSTIQFAITKDAKSGDKYTFEVTVDGIVETFTITIGQTAEEGKEIETAVDALKDYIPSAKELLKRYKISEDGTNVSTGERWITQKTYDTYEAAIKKAEDLANSALADLTLEKVQEADAELKTATAEFESKVLLGKKAVTIASVGTFDTKNSQVLITVATDKIADGESVKFAWIKSESNPKSEPKTISIDAGDVKNNKSTIIIEFNKDVKVGSYVFQVTIDGVKSDKGTVIIPDTTTEAK